MLANDSIIYASKCYFCENRYRMVTSSKTGDVLATPIEKERKVHQMDHGKGGSAPRSGGYGKVINEMMTKDQINRILSKSKPTGKEVGRLHLEKLFNDLILARQKKPPVQFFTGDDLQRMISTFTDQKDLIDYQAFFNMRNSLFDLLLRIEMNVQQVYHGIYAAIAQLNDIKSADLEKRGVDTTPVIMTFDQYRRLREKEGEDRANKKASYAEVLLSCLGGFLLVDSETVKQISMEVFNAIEETKTKLVADSYVMGDYIKNHCAYSVLPDGTQSNLVSKDEWEASYKAAYRTLRQVPSEQPIDQIIQNDNLERLRKQYELFYRGGSCIRDYVKDKTGTTPSFDDETLEDAMEIILGEEDGPIDSKVEEAKEQLLKCFEVVPIETRYHNPPDDLTLYNLLPSYIEMSNRCPSDLKEILEHLRIEAPQLYSSLLSYVEGYLPDIGGLDAAALCEKTISWGKFLRLDLIASKMFTPSDETIVSAIANGDTTKDWSIRFRARHNGIAVIMPANGLDDGKDYVEKVLQSKTFYNLPQREKVNRYASILSYYGMIKSSLRYVYAFNTLLGLLAKIFKIPDLKIVLSYDTSTVEERVGDLNNLLTHTYHNVYGNKEERLDKRMAIKSVFEIVDVNQLKPTPATIKEVSRKISQVVLLPNSFQYLETLEVYVLDLTRQ